MPIEPSHEFHIEVIEPERHHIRQRSGVAGFFDRNWGRIWLLGVLAPTGVFLNLLCQVAAAQRFPAAVRQHHEWISGVGSIVFVGIGLLATIVPVCINQEMTRLEKLMYLFASFWLVLLVTAVAAGMSVAVIYATGADKQFGL